jgi:hypothetical protein
VRFPLRIEAGIIYAHEVKYLRHLKHAEDLFEMNTKMTISKELILIGLVRKQLV